MINNRYSNLISFNGYKSVMVETVNKAVKDEVATIHCAYSGDIFTPSTKHKASIEHIKLRSKEGPNKDSNFLPVKKEDNHNRANIPLPDYIESHPEIIENVKKTISEVARLKSVKFDGKKWAKEVIESFSKEAKHPIEIDLDNIGPTIYVEDAIKTVKPKINTEKPPIIDKSKKTFQEQLEEIKKKLNFSA